MSVPPFADHLCGELYTKNLPNLWVTSDGFLGYIKPEVRLTRSSAAEPKKKNGEAAPKAKENWEGLF